MFMFTPKGLWNYSVSNNYLRVATQKRVKEKIKLEK